MADPVAAEPVPSTPASASPAPTPAVTPPAAATPPVAAAPATPPATAAPPDPAKPVEPAKPAVVAPVVPEKYDFAAVKLPEGMALDQPLLDAVSPVFKELGLTQEAASKLVEATVKAQGAIETKKEADFKSWMANQMTQHVATLKSEWGLAYDSNLSTAQRGMARYCSPAMKAILDETGLGQHPEFVKAFLQIGKSVTEDNPPAGGSPANSGKSMAQTLYGSTTPSH